MRIAYLMTAIGCGGAEMQVFTLVREMRRRNHDVVVVRLRDEPSTLLPKFAGSGIDCLSLGLNKHHLLLAALFRARRWAREWRPDVIHSHMVHANIFGRLMRLTVHVSVVVSTAHNVNEGGALRTLAYRLTDPLADVTTNVSPNAVAAFIRKGACPRSRIMHVANGLDLGLFRSDPEARARVRGELGLDHSFVFLAVGRLFAEKDYPSMIDAFAQVHQRRGGTRLLIAGDGPCRPDIEGLIASLPVSPGAVRLLGLRSDIPALMNAADCFVMSSVYEGAPMVVIEAMSCGKAVVTTEFGGAASLLGDCGVVVPAGRPDLLAAAMLNAADHPQVVNHAARDRAESMFSIATIADSWESIYSRHSHPASDRVSLQTRVGLES